MKENAENAPVTVETVQENVQPAIQVTNVVDDEMNVSELIDDYNKLKKEKQKLVVIVVNQTQQLQKLQSKLESKKDENNINWMTHFSEKERKMLKQIPKI